MLKGLYFMGWYRDMWNYHPSLPMKNMQMVEDITAIQANMLIWSCLGSGAIGLPYLDKEAFGDTPPRLRLYGFMNDQEFCAECAKRGVKVFAVLWKAQLWEFGAELNEDESKLLSLNILRGASGNRAYVGMRELSTDRYPKLFDPIGKYFPDGLKDYKGRTVSDFLTEFKAVSLEGRDILSSWLMAPGHDHKCYTPCCNKDSYLRYMKRDVEMMIDAGAGGLHIDEYDTQKHVLHNAGCFCPECVDQFRDFLIRRRAALPADAGDIAAFDYRAYLLRLGIGDEDLLACNASRRWDIPLYRHFYDMQLESVEWVVRELSAHAKQYAARSRSEAFPVTANLYQCFPLSWNCKKYLDLLAGEKTDIRLRQDGWYKFAFAWLNGKECCFAEDPNAYVRDMLQDIKNGINDRFILFALEPLAHGFHIAFPYGSWLQNQVKDAFWPDLRVLRTLGPWLDAHEALFPKHPVAGIAVLYDLPSAYENAISETTLAAGAQPGIRPVSLEGVTELGSQGAFSGQGDFHLFFDLVQALSDRNILYNVVYESPDEPLTVARLDGYHTLVVPDAFLMDGDTETAIRAFAEAGGRVLTYGRSTLGEYHNYAELPPLVHQLAALPAAVTAEPDGSYGISLQKTDRGYALHIVNYRFNPVTHRLDTLVPIRVRLNVPAGRIRQYSFPENPSLAASVTGQVLTIENAGIYTVIELEGKD